MSRNKLLQKTDVSQPNDNPRSRIRQANAKAQARHRQNKRHDQRQNQPSKSNIIYLSNSYIRVYYYLLDNREKGFWRKQVAISELGISPKTLERSIARLVECGILEYEYIVESHINRYTMDLNIKVENNGMPVPGLNHDQRHDQRPPISKQESFLNSSLSVTRIAETLQADPDLWYWRGKITPAKIHEWISELQLDVALIFLYLKYLDYDLTVNRIRDKSGVEIGKPLGYFYKILSIDGMYPEPTGFKTRTELKAEKLEKARASLERAQKRIECEEFAKKMAQAKLIYEKIKRDPENPIHKKCIEIKPDINLKLHKIKALDVIIGILDEPGELHIEDRKAQSNNLKI